MRPKLLKSLLLIGIFVSSLLISCGTDEDFVDDRADNIAFGIRHDRNLSEYEAVAANEPPYNTSDYPDFDAVVNFTYSLDGSDNHEFVATGTLISSEWVLTAGHNFFTSDEQKSPAKVGGIDVNIGVDPNNPDQVVGVAELIFHPTYLSDDDLFGTANDLCLVKLSSPVSLPAYAKINASTNETIGNTVWYCGYGDYSFRSGQNPDLYSIRHAVENVLDRKSSGIFSQTGDGTTYLGGLVAFDFDDPDGLVNSLGDDYLSEDENLLGSGTSTNTATSFEGTTVEGDSGGPLFIKMEGEWKVIGVLSGGATAPIQGHRDGDYGDISIFTRVSTSIDWINSVIN